MLFNTEIPTIETCAALIYDFPEMPSAFFLDIASQISDECRHAEFCCLRIRDLGGKIGEYPCDHRLWNMQKGHPIEVRLAIHQRIGESIGIDAAIANMREYFSWGDVESAKVMSWIALDEINHVAIGNKWINFLVGEERIGEIHRTAESIRASSGGNVNMLAYEVTEWAYLRAGYTMREIDNTNSQRNIFKIPC